MSTPITPDEALSALQDTLDSYKKNENSIKKTNVELIMLSDKRNKVQKELEALQVELAKARTALEKEVAEIAKVRKAHDSQVKRDIEHLEFV